MKQLILTVGFLAFIYSAQAQHFQVGVRAAASYSLPQGDYLPNYLYVVPVSGGTTGSRVEVPDVHTYSLQSKVGGTVGLTGRYRTASSWGWGAELLLQYQPIAVEKRFSPEKAGYNDYVSPTGSFPGGGIIRDPNGQIVIVSIASTNAISRADLPTTYRYSMIAVELPLYATYDVTERWHLQAGVAPSLLLDNQARIITSYPKAQGSKVEVAESKEKQNDSALRRFNWRFVAGAEYQIASNTALSLYLRPSVSNIFTTTARRELLIPYQIRQHVISIGLTQFFSAD